MVTSNSAASSYTYVYICKLGRLSEGQVSGSRWLSQCRTLLFELMASTSPFIMMGVFEIGSHKLFAWAGFEPQSS
jgi:hypothetical protein